MKVDRVNVEITPEGLNKSRLKFDRLIPEMDQLNNAKFRSKNNSKCCKPVQVNA